LHGEKRIRERLKPHATVIFDSLFKTTGHDNSRDGVVVIDYKDQPRILLLRGFNGIERRNLGLYFERPLKVPSSFNLR
jgi:hypothetical protein